MMMSLANIQTIRRRQSRRPRRGMAILMVLLLLSLTLGLCYAAMRSQGTIGMIQRNANRGVSARQAAMTGLSIALKKMHQNSWGGVDSSVSGRLSDTESFLVTFATGDPRLTSSDKDYPYRVTLRSTGYAVDPNQATSIASHSVQAVVQLIPRALAAEPSDWSTMMNFTFYQYASGNFLWDPPGRIEGPVRIQLLFLPAWNYSWWGDPRNQFLKDLNAMYVAKVGDYRPFNGTVSLPTTIHSLFPVPSVMTTLNTHLGISTSNVEARDITSISFPNTMSTYRLYPGGKLYAFETLSSGLSAVAKTAAPATNPAGLFACLGNLTIGNNVSVNGTVFTSANSGGRITLSGAGISMTPVALPALQGESASVQLPAAVAGNDFIVGSGTSASVTGVVVAKDNFSIDSADDTDIIYTHKGKLIAENVSFNPRTNWNSKLAVWWASQYTTFDNQKNNLNGIKYFPVWLQKKCSLNYEPKVKITSDSTSYRYHWHNPQNTSIYTALASDGGLRWDLVYWTEKL